MQKLARPHTEKQETRLEAKEVDEDKKIIGKFSFFIP